LSVGLAVLAMRTTPEGACMTGSDRIGGTRRAGWVHWQLVVLPLVAMAGMGPVGSVRGEDAPAVAAGDTATEPGKATAPAKLLERVRADQQAWLGRWSRLRLTYRETFLACPGCERPVYPVGTVTHHEIRLERDGRVWTHQYDVVDEGRFPRREAAIFHPAKLLRLNYPPEDSRYENPRELNTSGRNPSFRYAGVNCLPLEPMWWGADWFPNHKPSPNVELVGHDTVQLDGRDYPRLTFRWIDPTGRVTDPGQREMSTVYDPARHHLPRLSTDRTGITRIDEFREVVPGWWMPWKGYKLSDFAPQPAKSETGWELLEAEVDPTFSKSDFEPPFGPDTIETTGTDRRPVVLPGDAPPPDQVRRGPQGFAKFLADPSPTWGPLGIALVLLSYWWSRRGRASDGTLSKAAPEGSTGEVGGGENSGE
jgi:hypothetical protein